MGQARCPGSEEQSGPYRSMSRDSEPPEYQGRRFRDRLAVVTGAASGIGRAIAERLDAEGAAVALVDVDLNGLQQAIPDFNAGFAYVADVGDSEQITSAFSDIRRDLGDPDILVNNAAYEHAAGTVLEISPDDWRSTIGGTLSSVYFCSREVLTKMVERRAGAIVNIASVGGVTGFGRSPGYTSAKAAVIQLTRALAIDYGPFGIRVNSVSPGAIATPRIERLPDYDEIRRIQIGMSVLGRTGRPGEIAAAVAFLAADEASFITGTNLIVDGGWTLR